MSKVVVNLLAAILPNQQPAAISELASHASGQSAVKPHINKDWGELTEREQLAVVRAIGVTARGATGVAK